MGRTTILIWDSTAACTFASSHTMENCPTLSPYKPIFLAKDWAKRTRCPSLTKVRRACASLSGSPEAKPWYAMSKNTWWSLDLITCEISAHWAAVGSTPVGLWAHACNSTLEPPGALSRSSSIP
eukprot:Lithocolla_globosa_v1_NODE_1505_length_2524_cov_47.443499.p3 type:complete len:124 gc:universal NODE_1505_length_2524_cov_47.443499:1555-1926(+)